MSDVSEARKALVEQVAADIAAGKPFFWESGIINGGRPKNLTREGESANYHGGNRMRLAYQAMRMGYKDNRWATYKQAQSIGAQVKKGEKATVVEYYQFEREIWKKNEKTGKKEPVYETDPETGEKKIKKVRLAPPPGAGRLVFNAEQMENVPPLPEFERPVEPLNEKMERMIANSEASIHHDQHHQNFYTVSTDEIHLVSREEFKTDAYYYATAAHEIAHSTGHESRLNREFGGQATDTYAREELRAELTSMFLHQEYGISFDKQHYDNHAAYLKSWANALRKNPDELFRAAHDAEKAADYIKTNMIEKTMDKEKVQTQAVQTERLAVVTEERPAEEKGVSPVLAARISKIRAAKKAQQQEASAKQKPVARKRTVKMAPKKEAGKSRSLSR